MVAVSEFNAVREALKQMVRFLCKKASEAESALDYYEGRITGNELFAIFQREVEAGRRERRNRIVTIDAPFKYPLGDRMMKHLRNVKLRDALGGYRAKVTPEDFQKTREEHFVGGLPTKELAKIYPQYSRTTIRRILGRGRGYVLVKGRGRVNTGERR